ncbi:unnamed protein product [Candida verbasci]|uniref:Ribosomal RNA-processing protein 8 n=1 Tax=Candida verbasci TaxID=1227364 RepID=A0A9W4TVZ9_9ASCO|nr:unnamed protein product [Candida verbasci]
MLFEPTGWKLDTKSIKLGGVLEKKSKNQKKKGRLAKRKENRENEELASSNLQSNSDKIEDKSSKQEKIEKKDKNKKIKQKSDDSSKTERSKNNNKESKDEKTEKLESAPIPVTSKLTPLQQKMMNKLSGSRFRWINEKLYTIKSEDALKLIQEQPVLFDEYHQGFKSQVQSWPENPVNVFVDQIKTRGIKKNVNAPGGLPGLKDKKVVIADMGCGEAQLALDVNSFVSKQSKKIKGRKLNIEVHSFDLKKYNDRITVADIKNVPLSDESCSVVIFCLALMGTNFLDFIKEAYRLLIPRGELWIAEIKSRFSETEKNQQDSEESVGKEFVETLKLCGFFHKSTDNSNKMFTRFEFFKPPLDILKDREEKQNRKRKFIEDETEKEKLEHKREKKAEGSWLLKPCIYKRR